MTYGEKLRRDQELHRIRRAALDAERAYRAAKAQFVAVTEAYASNPRYDAVTAEHKAAGDPRRVQASADAEWFRAEMDAYANLGTFLAVLADMRQETTA